MNIDFQFRDKVPVAVLGATGTVGQRFIALLAHHPWFEIVALAASEKSVGKPYHQAVNWLMDTPLPPEIGALEVQPCDPTFNCKLVFSGLDSSVAGEIETAFANAGYTVVSNSSNHRQDSDVPLIIAEVNREHLQMIKKQKSFPGAIITNPNCSAIGLTLALKPLHELFGIEQINVVTMQSISGAGYPGVASLDILDNIVPYIPNEEDKLENEPLKILGSLSDQGIEPAPFRISAQCNRVPVSAGHLECVSIKLKKKATQEEIIQVWRSFKGAPQEMNLPTAPTSPIHYFDQPNYPQPKLHRDLERGMAVSIGRLRPCPLLDYRFVLLSHNTIRGAAGGAILIAELMLKEGLIFW